MHFPIFDACCMQLMHACSICMMQCMQSTDLLAAWRSGWISRVTNANVHISANIYARESIKYSLRSMGSRLSIDISNTIVKISFHCIINKFPEAFERRSKFHASRIRTCIAQWKSTIWNRSNSHYVAWESGFRMVLGIL